MTFTGRQFGIGIILTTSAGQHPSTEFSCSFCPSLINLIVQLKIRWHILFWLGELFSTGADDEAFRQPSVLILLNTHPSITSLTSEAINWDSSHHDIILNICLSSRRRRLNSTESWKLWWWRKDHLSLCRSRRTIILSVNWITYRKGIWL